MYEELRQFVARTAPPIEFISSEANAELKRHHFIRVNLMRALIIPDPKNGLNIEDIEKGPYYDVIMPIVCKFDIRSSESIKTGSTGQLCIIIVRFNLLELYEFNVEVKK